MAKKPVTRITPPKTAATTSVSPLEQSGSSNTKGSSDREHRDICQIVTNHIIEALEAGVKPWICPWKPADGASGIPANFATRRAYKGMNIMLLWMSAAQRGYQESRWLTYRQACLLGGSVRKGEHGTTLIFYKMIEKEENGETRTIPVLRTFTVFNLEQVDGLPLSPDPTSDLPACPFEPIPQVECLFTRHNVKWHERGHQAYYLPSRDEIWLPERQYFTDAASFYATGLHELVHWTGAPNRLNRKHDGKFGSESYAFEELIAELGCAFLMAALGVKGEVQHDNYIASWLKSLKNDKRYIFRAATAASAAYQYLIG